MKINIQTPDFFILGAPKSGTTALYKYLNSHPDIRFLAVKEPHYFASDIGWQPISSERDYQKLFPTKKNNQLIGEASVFYLYSIDAVPAITKRNRTAKFIVMIRDPIEILTSLFFENKKSGDEDSSDLADAWINFDKCLLKKKRNPAAFNYPEVALLGAQTKRLLENIDPHQVIFIDFKEFTLNPRQVYVSVLEFLNLADDGRVSFEVENKGSDYRFLGLNTAIVVISDALGLRFPGRKTLRKIADLIRSSNAVEKNLDWFASDFKLMLEAHFESDQKQLWEEIAASCRKR